MDSPVAPTSSPVLPHKKRPDDSQPGAAPTHELPFELRRPLGPRDPGDAWVEGDRGRFWGRFGSAGPLVHDPAKGILLQHRALWSDQGGTWGLPGGTLIAEPRETPWRSMNSRLNGPAGLQITLFQELDRPAG